MVSGSSPATFMACEYPIVSLGFYEKRNYSFPVELFWQPYQTWIDYKCKDLFLYSKYYSMDLYLYASSKSLDYCSFNFRNQAVWIL